MRETEIAKAKKERSKCHGLLGSCHAHYTDSEKILARNYTIKGKTPIRPRWVFSLLRLRRENPPIISLS